MDSKKNVLVTGGFGMVGMALQKVVSISKMNLNHNFYFLSRKDCDLRDKAHVYNIFESYQPKIVIHLASRVGGVYDNMNNNYTFLSDNTTLNMNIVDACKHFQVELLVNVLSTCIFPDQEVTYPLTSDQLHNGLPHHSNIGYAYSKRVLHIASELLSQTTQTRVVNLIPTNLYGEHDNYNLTSSHVVPALIHKVFLAKQTDQSLRVNGSGRAIRQFLYADDFADIICQFMNVDVSRPCTTCVVSPPNSSEVSIKQLVDYICQSFDFTGEVIYDTSFQDGQLKKTTNDNELQLYLPTYEFTDLKEGIDKVVSHFIQNYPTHLRV